MRNRFDTGQRTTLVNGGTSAHVLPTGQLVCLHDDALYGLPFDARTLQVTPSPVLLVENILASGGGQFAISSNGTLVYQTPLAQSLRSLVWVDRQRSRGANPRVRPPPISIRASRLTGRGWP